MYKSIKNQKNNTKYGFSLVEMLVATAVFMSIITIAVGSLISLIDANKRAQSIKSTVDSVTFAVENISRDMRGGTEYQCLSDGIYTKSTVICSLGSNAVKYLNSSGDTIIYTFNGVDTTGLGVLTKEKNGAISDLISQDSNVNITDMKFYVIGSDNELNPNQASRTQPRMIITTSGLISVKGNNSSFNLQTNISQRTRK